MRRAAITILSALLMAGVLVRACGAWEKPVAPAVPSASGYVAIPGAAVMPEKSRIYRAVFDATRAADQPGQLVPALDMVGSELNVIVGSGLPRTNGKFVVVFHDDAVDGILNDASYRAKHHASNPNLKVIAELKRAGVELYVCGQYLAFNGIDPKSLVPEVRVATDALIVLMAYQMDGYALMSF